MTEVQMLLHDHPLARRHGKPVHGVWFSGGGVLPKPAGIPAFEARAAAGRDGDVLRGLARVAQGVAGPVGPLTELRQSRERLVVALPRVESPADLADLARDFLAPALDGFDLG